MPKNKCACNKLQNKPAITAKRSTSISNNNAYKLKKLRAYSVAKLRKPPNK